MSEVFELVFLTFPFFDEQTVAINDSELDAESQPDSEVSEHSSDTDDLDLACLLLLLLAGFL